MALIMAIVLGGCADLTVPYKKPTFGFLSKYNKSQASNPVLLSNNAWWQGLEDATLNRLIVAALEDNLSLELARERVVAARAARNGVSGTSIFTPTADVTVSDGSGSTPRSTATELGLSWMLDPYGARGNELRAATARTEVAEAELDAARLLVLFNTANAYTNLRYAQRILSERQAEKTRRQSTLNLTRKLKNAESATKLETTRSRARVLEIQSQLPTLKANITAQLNELTVLIGKVPGNLPHDLKIALDSPRAQPSPHLSPDIGIPADLLRNRPDIHIAERSYYAAVADIGVARAGLYPRLSLSGAISLNALSGGTSTTEYYFGPSVQFPNIPLQPAREAVKARHSAARQAHTTWKTTVLTAILEVENALADYQAASTSLSSAREARGLYNQTLALTRKIFENGEATLGDLIDAEEALAQSDRSLTDLRLQHTLRFIALNVRLGAGHDGERTAK
jgi:multidrug efflux system outer membrane protein